MNAAKVARFEEWSFHEFRTSADTFGYTRVQAEGEVESFDPVWWMTDEDKLWPVGGGCLDDQECEDACKWRGAPVCHPTDHTCLCAELWEDEPGPRREDLYRGIWETDRKARQDVVRELSEEPQSQKRTMFRHEPRSGPPER